MLHQKPSKRNLEKGRTNLNLHHIIYVPQQNTESDGEIDENETKKSYILDNLDEIAEYLNRKPSKKSRN
jgi:hypothetical protein